MVLRPPRSPRTTSLLPYATLVLSGWGPLQYVCFRPTIAAVYHDDGCSRLMDEADELWSHISLVLQPQNAKFPILFQVADNEYLATLASYTALQQAKIPSEDRKSVV